VTLLEMPMATPFVELVFCKDAPQNLRPAVTKDQAQYYAADAGGLLSDQFGQQVGHDWLRQAQASPSTAISAFMSMDRLHLDVFE
jgi:hypothetical protein